MKLGFRCPAHMEQLLPRPKLARHGLPQWLARSTYLGPGSGGSDSGVGEEVQSTKDGRKEPAHGALATGFLLPLAADLEVKDGRFEWSWPLGAPSLEPYACAPVEFESCEHAREAPLLEEDGIIIRFHSFWSMELEPGWSLLVIHPVHREELPYRTLYGVIEADVPETALLSLPAMWIDPEFEGVLPRGTPIAQCIPIQRAALDLEFGVHHSGTRKAKPTPACTADTELETRDR